MDIREACVYAKIAILLPVVAAPLVYGVHYWLTPRPWSEQAITATFEGVGLDRTGTNLEFRYILRNHTRSDFHHDLGTKVELKPNRPSFDPKAGLADPIMQFPIDVPRRGAGPMVIRAGILLPRDGFVEDVRRRGPPRFDLIEWLRSSLSRLDGFTLTDRRQHYVIRLPKGW